MFKRTSYEPIEKPVRIKDEKALQAARDRWRCEVCGVIGPVEPHHISSRGAGGHDSEKNLISVCRCCHSKIHWGRVSRSTLKEIVERRQTNITLP